MRSAPSIGAALACLPAGPPACRLYTLPFFYLALLNFNLAPFPSFLFSPAANANNNHYSKPNLSLSLSLSLGSRIQLSSSSSSSTCLARWLLFPSLPSPLFLSLCLPTSLSLPLKFSVFLSSSSFLGLPASPPQSERAELA